MYFRVSSADFIVRYRFSISYSLINNDGLLPDPSVSEYSNAWIVVSDPENPNDSVASSTSFFSPTGIANRWLITPLLNLGSYGNTLQWEAKSQDASYPDDYLVLVSTTDMELSSFTDTIGYIIGENANWSTRQVNLSTEGYNDSSIYIAFVNVTEDGYKLYVDDIKVWKDDPSSVNELVQNVSLSVYPNPTKDLLNVISSEKFTSLKLFDVNGRLLQSTEDNQLTMLKYPEGIYFMKILFPGYEITKKIVKN